MFTVSKEFRFEAAHSLPKHDGKCRNPHGHSYRVVAHVRGEAVQMTGSKTGMVVDYSDLGAALKGVCGHLDHCNLNDRLPFTTTAENLAAYIFAELDKQVAGLWAVDVHETATTRVRYER